MLAVWERGNRREKVEGHEDRVREKQGGRGWNLRWSAFLPWPRWLNDRNLQLWQFTCDSSSWWHHQIMLACQMQFPAAGTTTTAAADSTGSTNDTTTASHMPIFCSLGRLSSLCII